MDKYMIVCYKKEYCPSYNTYFYITTFKKWFVTIPERSVMEKKLQINEYRSNVETVLRQNYNINLTMDMRKKYNMLPLKNIEGKIPYFVNKQDAQKFIEEVILQIEIMRSLNAEIKF